MEALQRQLEKKGNNNRENEHPQFIWKVARFSLILQLAKAERKIQKRIYSAPFYTENYGYRLKVAMDPNGSLSSGNTHLSVYIIVMKGEYDELLSWPFRKKIKITLIDQQGDPAKRENVADYLLPLPFNEGIAERPKSEEYVWRGKSQFISHEELQTRRYLVDDALFLQVEIYPL